MTTKKTLTQAYRQAPWRIQAQRGLPILAVILILTVAVAIYESVSIQASEIGLEIQSLQYRKIDLKNQIAHLNGQIGLVGSGATREKRAKDLGFQLAKQEEIVYMVVPGYAGRLPVTFGEQSTAMETPEDSLISPVYTETLSEWLIQGVLKASTPLQGGQP